MEKVPKEMMEKKKKDSYLQMRKEDKPMADLPKVLISIIRWSELVMQTK